MGGALWFGTAILQYKKDWIGKKKRKLENSKELQLLLLCCVGYFESILLVGYVYGWMTEGMNGCVEKCKEEIR